ncbi:hypothetical protein ACRALDRAFT_207829 [Sodiomyces alcalophilus JCM 7366]|uniref:uncharacterized protein n=1 Tax=Sodiomyces alcalophilus JCM 7366 TaxID=591952 RepID=UPI0039B5DFDA
MSSLSNVLPQSWTGRSSVIDNLSSLAASKAKEPTGENTAREETQAVEVLRRLTRDDWARFAQQWRDSYKAFTKGFVPGRRGNGSMSGSPRVGLSSWLRGLGSLEYRRNCAANCIEDVGTKRDHVRCGMRVGVDDETLISWQSALQVQFSTSTGTSQWKELTTGGRVCRSYQRFAPRCCKGALKLPNCRWLDEKEVRDYGWAATRIRKFPHKCDK